MAKKKEKVHYVDDGRTLADMSNVTGGFGFGRSNGYRAPLKEQLRTFWEAFKMMLVPTLILVVGLGVAAGIMWLLLKLA